MRLDSAELLAIPHERFDDAGARDIVRVPFELLRCRIVEDDEITSFVLRLFEEVVNWPIVELVGVRATNRFANFVAQVNSRKPADDQDDAANGKLCRGEDGVEEDGSDDVDGQKAEELLDE